MALGQHRVYYVGHSLISLDIPYQTRQLLDEAGIDNTYRHHINNGASIQLNWEDTLFNPNPIWTPSLGRDVEYGTNHLKELKNPYDYLVLTEAIPLFNYDPDTTAEYFSRFIHLAVEANPDIEVLIYATWEHDVFNTVQWIEEAEKLIPRWESILHRTIALAQTPNMHILPGNMAMIQLFHTLSKGPIGSLSSIEQLFEPDGVHPNFDGKYFMACLFAAVIGDIDPRQLPVVKAGPYTEAIVVQEEVVRKRLQEIARDVACSYASSGYVHSTCTTRVEDRETHSPNFQFPALFHRLSTSGLRQERRMIYDISGQIVRYYVAGQPDDLSTLPAGIYLLVYRDNQGVKHTQKLVKI